MALSNKWNDETTIYLPITKRRDLTKRIYRCNGLEAFVVGEDDETYHIDNMNKVSPIRCKIWKKFTKSKIIKVPEDYILKNK
jgi:hypothetical protein